MRKTNLITLISLTIFFLVSNFAQAAEIKEADTLFEKNNFQQAAKIYEEVYQETTDPETRCRAFFRLCESLAHLFRYGEAAEKIINTPLPEKLPYRARILILKAEMLRNFLQQYSYIQRKDVIDDEEETSDPFRLTPEEIKQEINKSYQQLWELQRQLITLPLKDEGYYFDIKDVDFGMFPTMFDYLVLSWTDFLLNTEADNLAEGETKPAAQELLESIYSRAVNPADPPALLAAAVMAAAGRDPGKIRREAAERWRIKRLLLPIQYARLFDFTGITPSADETPINICYQKIQGILLLWLKKFHTPQARAQAGYHAASIYNNLKQYSQAVELCQQVEKDFPKTHGARHCRMLRSRIEIPELTLTLTPVRPPGKEAISLTTRNLKNVYFRVFRMNPEQLRKEIALTNSYRDSWSEILNQPSKDWLEKYLAKQTLTEKWTFRTEDKGEYNFHTQNADPPELQPGIYLIMASGDLKFKIGSSLLRAGFLNVSDLILVGAAGFSNKAKDSYFQYLYQNGPREITTGAYRFYTFSAATGKPAAAVNLNIDIYSSHKSREMKFSQQTDQNGFSSLALPVSVHPGDSNYYNADPLAKDGKDYAYWRSDLYLNYYPHNPLAIFLETDRPIYRPGDTVKVKAIVVRKIPQGYETLGTNDKVTFIAQDTNGKDFFTKTVPLTNFGSVSIDILVPQGKLLGRYSIRAEASNNKYQNSERAYFSVEEYKRPEFEIILDPAKDPWKYDRAIEIAGRAKYYFGAPVPNAPVSYKIKRQLYIPWFYLYWFQDSYNRGGDEIAAGELKTDEEGNFSIPFTPTPPPGNQYQNYIPNISQFIVEVEARDAGGRTIEGQQSYRAGKNALYLVLAPKKGFFSTEGKVEIDCRRLTINDTAAAGKSTYRVYTLKKPAPEKLAEWEKKYPGNWYWIPPLDIQLKDLENDKLITSGEIQHDKEGNALLQLDKLAQDTYRIELKSKDPWGEEISQNKIIVVATSFTREARTKTAIPVPAASVTLAEKNNYQVGETARFVIGSVLPQGTYQLEIWAGEHFYKNILLDGNLPVRLIEVPVTKELKGGFTIRWFGIKNLCVCHGQIFVSVPWPEKKLDISLEPFTKILKPGEKASWGLIIKNAQGQPQAAEALALMYDRSLEYYVTNKNPWLNTLYTDSGRPNSGTDSVFNPYIINLPITEGLLSKIMERFHKPPPEPQLPGLRTWRTWGRGRYLMKSEARACKEMLMPCAAPAGDMDAMVEEEALGAGGPDDELAAVPTRTEFADTAFFKPHLVTDKKGKVKFSFTAPSQLTSWKIKALAFTKDVKEGTLTEEAITKKELMTRVSLPRFFREKDQGTISAIVHNESGEILEGKLQLTITENGKPANEKLKLSDNKKTFSIKPHDLASFNWPVDIPDGVTTYKVRAAAVSGELSDAEERDLPVYPSRQRLIESAFTSLLGTETKTLEIRLKEDPTRINESMVLSLDPQLTLSILNTLPFLVEYPYACVEQTLNKFVPLAITNEIYKKYPAIQQAVSKIPKRTTVTPPWEKDDPRRLTTLMETPWIWESEGRPVSFPIIDMLDPKIVAQQKKSKLEKLRSAQLASGAFPWWPGGKPDAYMTLYVLAGFAEARRYGVSIPEEMIQKALKYINKEIPLKLKAEERFLSLVCYAAYVVTSYPEDEFSEAKKGREAARAWVEFLERHLQALTPLGKAYLSYTYLRLGDEKRAEELLDMALDGVREDPIAGAYWAPEKYSWVWYNDTVEKHAFFLRTLQELRPDDKLIPGMVQWLLFNRKGNVWKSTKASSAAIYALLDFLRQRGALASNENFKINWGKDKFALTVKADQWYDDPFFWQKTGFEITPEMSKATINKEGPGMAFASMTWTYSTDQLPEASGPGLLELQRKFYRRVKEGDKYHLKPVKSGDKVQVGDQIEVQLKINTRSQFEYMQLKDLKAAGFEAETLLSGWKRDPLSYYEEPRDSLTNFFISWLPHGEYILRYRLKPTKPGRYRVGAATLQSMYAPEMTAHSAGVIIEVTE